MELTHKDLVALLRKWSDDLNASIKQPQLILHDWFGTSPVCTPSFVKDNLAHLESLPVDGVALYLRKPDLSDNVTVGIMANQIFGYDRIAAVLSPVKGIEFKTLKENFAAVISKTPPDFFDDWSPVIQNFTDLARAAKDVGLKGIYFDNEQYFSKWGNYPDGVKDKTKTLRQCQEQAFLRGTQVMQAMQAVFPKIVVISLHGPYVSDLTAPAPLFPQWQIANELLGPLFEGMLAVTKTGLCVDGGELYHLRSAEDFQKSYDWRKAKWPTESVGFGVYDKPMTSALLTATLINALQKTDRYVWLYIEGPTFLRPGPSDPFVAAVRAARA